MSTPSTGQKWARELNPDTGLDSICDGSGIVCTGLHAGEADQIIAEHEALAGLNPDKIQDVITSLRDLLGYLEACSGALGEMGEANAVSAKLNFARQALQALKQI